MKLPRHVITIVCILAVPAANAGEGPIGNAGGAAKPTPEATTATAENVDLVKGLIVTGTMKQIIGNFGTYGHPGVGDTFEIDLTNLPKEKIEFTRSQSDPMAPDGPYPSYVPFSAPLTIEQVDTREKDYGSSLIRLSSIDPRSESTLVLQVRAPELEKGSKARIFFYEERFGRIICMAEAEGLLMARRIVARGAPVLDEFHLAYPKKDHVTALQLYQMGGSAKAIDKIIGQFVLLDVIVVIERDIPLVEIVIPEALSSGSAHPPESIHAHLISVTTEASSLKKGERFRVEGIIVQEGYGAYMIYLQKARKIK